MSLLKLNRAVHFSNKAGLVCLPPSTYQSFEGKSMTVSGCGITNDHSVTQSPALQATKIIGANMVLKNSFITHPK